LGKNPQTHVSYLSNCGLFNGSLLFFPDTLVVASAPGTILMLLMLNVL